MMTESLITHASPYFTRIRNSLILSLPLVLVACGGGGTDTVQNPFVNSGGERGLAPAAAGLPRTAVRPQGMLKSTIS